MEKVTKEVMGAVFYKDGRILIMRRAPFLSWAGWWEFPGGKLEKGESNEECLARELREELDFRVRNGIGYTLFSMDTSKYVYCPQADNVIALFLIYQGSQLGKHFF